MQRCIIVGASHAGAQVAASLRQQGWAGEICLVGEELFMPYHRPPLSKDFLAGKKGMEDIFIRPAAFYEKVGVQLLLGARATAIDRHHKQLLLADGEALPYDYLVLATGARVRRLPIPGAELPGVCYLRNIADVETIRGYLGKGKEAVIIGGGYIGLEAAAVLRRLGLQVRVLEAMSRVMQRVTAPEVSEFYTRLHAEEGVEIFTDTAASAITGSKRVTGVETQNGQGFAANLVIVGIGVEPAVELAEQAGLAVKNGILVDEFGRTPDAAIWAAGDCTRHFNPIYGRELRLESVQNAVDQAGIVAASICGKPRAYETLPWFWSDQYDVKLQIAGLSEGYDELVLRGDSKQGRSFAAFYLRQGRLLAVDAINRPQEFMIGKRLILARQPVDVAVLANENFSIKACLS